MFLRRSVVRYFYALVFVIISVLYLIIDYDNLNAIYEEKKRNFTDTFLYNNPLIEANKFIYPTMINYEMKDWHDYHFMDYEAKRIGPGEQGEPVYLQDLEDKNLVAETYAIEGLSVVTSDKISVNRSIPDVRHEKYLIELFYNKLDYVEEQSEIQNYYDFSDARQKST